MKATLFDNKGTKKDEISLPAVFSTQIREDIAGKCFEAEKALFRQAYSSDPEAGKKHSASGTISHRRHEWKGHYGKGISRVPRKAMWRRGTQFYWVGAEISSARGGRRSHPPKGIHGLPKINSKEMRIALNSALAATVKKEYLTKRYATLGEINVFPAVIESLPQKTKALIAILKHIFGNGYDHVLQHKKVRSGVGKRRGRTYKSNAGLLIVVGKEEKISFSGVKIRTPDEIMMRDVYPLGRLTLYTKQALEELNHVA